MDNDIVLLLYEIKESITNYDKNNDYQELEKIEEKSLKMLELLKLFLISERNTYYGYFLMNMKYEVAFRDDFIAGIKLNTFPPVFIYNPLSLCKFKLKEIIYIICHEIDHIVFNHPAEMVKNNPDNNPATAYKLNLACDAAVNDRLNSEIEHKKKYLQQPSGVITSEVLKEMFHLKYVSQLENYLYYYNLIKDFEIKESQSLKKYLMDGLSEVSDSNNKLNGQSKNSDSTPREVTKSEFDLNENDEEENVSEIEDHNWMDGETNLDVSDLIKEYINSTYSIISGEGRGLLPSSFIDQVKLINEDPKISWKSVLKKYVGTVVAGKRKTKTRLNRRQPERFDLSGRVDEKTIKIVVAIDTSGSMSNDDIASIFNEIFTIIATRKCEITVIECDAEIQKIYKVKKRSDVQSKVKGRGGTSFTPVIEYINQNKFFRDSLLIYFTDGCGDYSIPKPLVYRIIWVLTEDGILSLDNPYGIVLEMK